MKYFITVFFIIGAVAIIALAGTGLVNPNNNTREQDFLRLHIRANSNLAADQNVKYLVRQQIVNELTPAFAGVTSKAHAMDILAENLTAITDTTNAVLADNGFEYTARAAIKSEHFPTRVYTTTGIQMTLPEGTYDALVIELGAGAGDNWWSVVYPPLCFLENNIGGTEGVRYRSKLHELIARHF